MKHFTLPRRAASTALLAMGLLAAVAGCSRKVAGVDAGYTTLEGRPDANARLLAWHDTPDTAIVWADLGTPGPDPDPDVKEDTLLGVAPIYRAGPGVIHTVLLDKTAASGFQFFRRAANGGMQSLTDYTVPASVKWLTTGWEMYSISDAHPSAYSPPTYSARGLLNGRVTTTSPLSNDVVLNSALPKASIVFSSGIDPVDSTLIFRWSNVPGAAGYWLDVYQFKGNATAEERRVSGTPNPVLTGNVKHLAIVYFPAGSATSASVGREGVRAGTRQAKAGALAPDVLTSSPLLAAQSYLVRVTAVDARGNVLAWMRGDYQLHQLDGFYEYYPLGAALVTVPGR